MLRNTTGLTGNHVRVTDMVKERRFTVIDVSHNGHNRATLFHICIVHLFVGIDFFHHMLRNIFGREAELFCHKVDGFCVQTLVDTNHNAKHHTRTDNFIYRHIHHRSEVIGSYELGEFQHFRLCLFLRTLFCNLLAFEFTTLTFMLTGSGFTTLLGLETIQRLFDLTLYFFVVYLNLNRFLVLGFALLIARIVNVHLVLFDAFAFTFFGVLFAQLLLLLLTFFALFFLLFLGLFTRVSSLIDSTQVYLSDHFRLVLKFRTSKFEDFRLLLLLFAFSLFFSHTFGFSSSFARFFLFLGSLFYLTATFFGFACFFGFFSLFSGLTLSLFFRFLFGIEVDFANYFRLIRRRRLFFRNSLLCRHCFLTFCGLFICL